MADRRERGTVSPHVAHREHVVPPLARRGRIAVGRAELERWGEELGRSIVPPLVVTVAGDLGAGKTTLVQAICRGYGVTDEVTSPTYALVHEYAAEKSPVYHLDLYRLADDASGEGSAGQSADELTNLGWDDILSAHALVLIEWPERAGSRLPPAHVPIDLEHLPGEPDRRVLLAG